MILETYTIRAFVAGIHLADSRQPIYPRHLRLPLPI